jgi:diguanylate cyclase (GGDEF)-like protein/PAS domain S-box-containing protein
MQESVVEVLLAGSAESATAVEGALGAYGIAVRTQRVATLDALRRAVLAHDWHIAVSDARGADFTALDLLALCTQAGVSAPVVVLRTDADDDVYLRCLETGACQFSGLDAAHLASLPRLVEALCRRDAEAAAQRLAAKRLLESEERFRDVFENTSDLIQCIAPDGSILYTNRAWREALGYSEEETRSLSLLDILHPDSTLCCQDRFQRLLGGESLNCIEFKFVAKSGEAVYLAGDCGSIVKEGDVVSTRGIFRNITDTVRAEAALQASEARYRALYENAPDIHAIVSARGEILSINRTGADMLGFDADELVGESVARVIHPEDQRAVFDCIDRLLAFPDTRVDIEYRKVRRDGSVFWVHQRASLEPGGDGSRLLIVCRDITEKRQLEDRLAFQASHDGLTQLLNRREFERRLHGVLAKAGADDRHVVCFLDLDRFKAINDSCGHIAGDELLRQIATLLKGGVRTRDTLARIGGDEFAVLMEHATVEQALVLAEKLCATIGQFEFHWRSQRFSVGVSIGVVPVRGGRAVADTLNLADMACYAAKREGGSRVRLQPLETASVEHLPPGP